ncbi:MAG: hypothetical protein DI621_28820 [Pseudomonas protegens]|nr:MAG: hypothetical protein DI621_28820 [Pseudomonas protegens]
MIDYKLLGQASTAGLAIQDQLRGYGGVVLVGAGFNLGVSARALQIPCSDRCFSFSEEWAVHFVSLAKTDNAYRVGNMSIWFTHSFKICRFAGFCKLV